MSRSVSIKVVFIIVVAIYCLTGITGFVQYDYVEQHTLENYFNTVFILLGIISVISGGLLFFFLTRIFKSWYDQINLFGKIMLPIVIVMFSYGFNKGCARLYNTDFGKQERFLISGKVLLKYFKRGSKRSKYYYWTVKDTVNNRIYEFKVSSAAYPFAPDINAVFQKEFVTGSLGIIYRKGL